MIDLEWGGRYLGFLLVINLVRSWELLVVVGEDLFDFLGEVVNGNLL